jgi:CBS domain-containing protein
MATAKDLVKKPISILKKSTISEVIQKLLETRVSRLLVQESGKPVGIITEKDVGLFLFDESTKQGLDLIPLENIMKKIVFVDGSESVENCAKKMIESKISSLALGSEESVEGVFTKTDLVQYYSQTYADKNKVVDFMTHDYVSTHSAAPLSKVVKKMLENKVSRVITKNQNNEPIGVISFRDLFRISLELGSEEDDTGFTLSDQIRRGFLSEEGFGGISLARDVMTKGIISIKFNEDLAKACDLLLENNVSGLAVLDGNQSLTGVISKTDITRALAS